MSTGLQLYAYHLVPCMLRWSGRLPKWFLKGDGNVNMALVAGNYSSPVQECEERLSPILETEEV